MHQALAHMKGGLQKPRFLHLILKMETETETAEVAELAEG